MLTSLRLDGNNLTGPIPPKLDNLAELRYLHLDGNNLTGPIPPELGNLAKLTLLHLDSNDLTGPIPPELGNLTNLSVLSLASNDLSGPVPSELGALTRVRWLVLAHNAGLTGPLPQSLTGLDLSRLLANGTGLCAPTDAVFQAWLGRMYRQRIAPCVAGELPTAYLTQAVQSREFPVPLVAGEEALLRVFPTAQQATSEGIPLVRARFYLAGRETHVQGIPGKSDPIPTEVDEGSLSGSANAEIAGRVIQPGLEMVIEVDPDNTLDPELGVATRIPVGGAELFSLSFTMPVTADADGSSSFAFALPVRAGWEDRLATITLSGPGGSVTLDGESDIPMAILRDPRTGQVRGILRDPPGAAEVAADGVGAPTPGLEVLFSRGIPDPAAWRR